MSSSVSEPPKPKPKRPQKGIAERTIDWQKTNDVARRFALTLDILSCLDCHEVAIDSESEEDTAEAMSVFVATCAYVLQSFAVTEKDAVKSFRNMFRLMRQTNKRLDESFMKSGKGRATARDVFAEVALAIEDE